MSRYLVMSSDVAQRLKGRTDARNALDPMRLLDGRYALPESVLSLIVSDQARALLGACTREALDDESFSFIAAADDDPVVPPVSALSVAPEPAKTK